MAQKISTENENRRLVQHVDDQWTEIFHLEDIWVKKSKLNTGEILQIMHYKHIQRPLEYRYSGVEMYFNLGGNVQLVDKDAIDTVLYSMQHNLLGATQSSGRLRLRFTGQPPYRIIRIILSSSYLRSWYGKNKSFDQLIARLADGQATWLYPQPQAVNRAVLSILYDIENCSLHGILKKRFLAVKIQELFILQLQAAEQRGTAHPATTRTSAASPSSQMAAAPAAPSLWLPEKKKPHQAVVLSNSDKEMLFAAKAYMQENLHEHLSIVKLARTVGTNEFKLKRGFKALFGTTVFHYLRDVRMAHARQLLLHGDKSLTEISRLVGYANLANFSNAFKAYHGYTPGTLTKQRLHPG